MEEHTRLKLREVILLLGSALGLHKVPEGKSINYEVQTEYLQCAGLDCSLLTALKLTNA